MNLAAARSRVDICFNELETAKQYLKARSLTRFHGEFGSPERDESQYFYDEALHDYEEKLAAFQFATKHFDDTRCKKQRKSFAAR
jgi:hypothetical protein